jgi:hypothetical protein
VVDNGHELPRYDQFCIALDILAVQSFVDPGSSKIDENIARGGALDS